MNVTTLRDEYETKISDFLGTSDFQTYKSYTERTMERYFVNNFVEYLDSEEKLTDVQKNNLIDSMHEDAKKTVLPNNANSEEESSDNIYTEKWMQQVTEYQNRQYESYLKASEKMLSASQLEKLKAYIKRQNEMMQTSLKMQMLQYGDQTKDNSSIHAVINICSLILQEPFK
jgi:hypothetical protein